MLDGEARERLKPALAARRLQDVSIGYESHDGDVARLYLEESFSFHVTTPEAAVALTA